MSHKKRSFDEVKGQTILSSNPYEGYYWNFRTNCGDYTLQVDDEGYGCNDSHAYISAISGLEAIIDKEIVNVEESSNSDEAEIKLYTADGSVCVINIIHDHNGYYGFSYELVKK